MVFVVVAGQAEKIFFIMFFSYAYCEIFTKYSRYNIEHCIQLALRVTMWEIDWQVDFAVIGLEENVFIFQNQFIFSFFFLFSIFFYEIFSHFDSSKHTRDAINHSKNNNCIDDKQKRDQHENKKIKKHHHPKNYVFLGKETSWKGETE